MPNLLHTLFPKIFSYTDHDSFISRLRQKRMAFLKPYLENALELSENNTVRILDIGGEYAFWKQSRINLTSQFHITLLNLTPPVLPDEAEGFSSIQGNACDLSLLRNKFDLAFSNSVIEHVEEENQAIMARQIQETFERFIIQTPNFWFPFDPHSQLPFFQFIPHSIRALMIYWCGNIDWFPKRNSYRECMHVSKSINMLSKSQLQKLFPNCQILAERMFGIPKSFIVVKGFNI